MKVKIEVSVHGFLRGPFEVEFPDNVAEEFFTHGSMGQIWVEPADKKSGDSYNIIVGGFKLEALAVTKK